MPLKPGEMLWQNNAPTGDLFKVKIIKVKEQALVKFVEKPDHPSLEQNWEEPFWVDVNDMTSEDPNDPKLKFNETNPYEAQKYLEQIELYGDIKRLPGDDETWAVIDEDGKIMWLYIEDLLDIANKQWEDRHQ